MSVAGTYNIVTKTPMGDQAGVFTVTVDGDSFTGDVSGAMGNMAVAEGKVSGQTLTWKMDMKVPMPMTLECEATIDGDPALHENVRVPGSHVGLGFNAVVLWIVADRLAQPEGSWRPFEPSGPLGYVYRMLTHEMLPI